MTPRPLLLSPPALLLALLPAASARADEPEPRRELHPLPVVDTATPPVDPAAHPEDPTGGAYTSPTLLFIPAAAVPVWNVRVIVSTEFQNPSSVHGSVQPGISGELGLPVGFTLAAGTNWVGGDINPSTGRTDANLGIAPYAQLRYHLYGDPSGQGFQLGASLTYKVVGFEGDPGEMELAVSAQYRTTHGEVGLQAVIGQDFDDAGDHDAEVHAYAVYRPIPELALGAAGQTRVAIAPDPDDTDSHYDLVGGALASLTLSRYQIGALGGATTIGLPQGHAGRLAQVFVTGRF